MRVLIGCEESGAVRRAFAAQGHYARSCDLLPAADGSPDHIQGDVLTVLDRGFDLAIFHPVCTYLTNAAAWALCDPDYDRWPGVGYHQRVKPGTLTGAARRAAKREALDFVDALARAKIERICMENPVGAMAGHLGWPFQTVQPWQFGDDASKATGLSLKNLPPLVATGNVPPRMVDGMPRWSNQTDSGQNRLSPGPNRARDRSRTFPGLAAAMAEQWGIS